MFAALFKRFRSGGNSRKNVDISSPRFRRRLEKLRHRKNLRREQVAEAIGISGKAYTNWETGKQKSAQEFNLMQLAKFHGVPYEYLVRGFVWPQVVRGAAIVVAIALVAVVAMAITREGSPVAFTRVLTKPLADSDHVRFADLDGDGMVELMVSSTEHRMLLTSVFRREDPDNWKDVPLYQETRIDDAHNVTCEFDVTGDGWKDLFVRCQNGDAWRIDAVDGHEGRPVESFPEVTGPAGPLGAWMGGLDVVSIVPHPDAGDTLVVTVVNTGRGAYPRYVEARSLWTDSVAWHYPTGAYLGEHYEGDVDGDGAPEFLFVCPSTNNGGFGNGMGDDQAWLFALDTDGSLMWKRRVGGTFDHATGRLLVWDGVADRAVVFVENRSLTNGEPSNLLLVRTATGEILESLDHSDQIEDKITAHRRPQSPVWDIYYGTHDGRVRAFSVEGERLHTRAQVPLGPERVFVGDVLAGTDEHPVIIANSRSGTVYLLDRDLEELVHRDRPRGGRYIYRGTFSDPKGDSYMAVLAAPDQLYIERVKLGRPTIAARLLTGW